jgi:hypothetical protein
VADDYVAQVVTDTYDCADGRWRELTIVNDRDAPVEIEARIDGDVLSLNGVHLPSLRLAGHGELLTVTRTIGESGIEITVASPPR